MKTKTKKKPVAKGKIKAAKKSNKLSLKKVKAAVRKVTKVAKKVTAKKSAVRPALALRKAGNAAVKSLAGTNRSKGWARFRTRHLEAVEKVLLAEPKLVGGQPMTEDGGICAGAALLLSVGVPDILVRMAGNFQNASRLPDKYIEKLWNVFRIDRKLLGFIATANDHYNDNPTADDRRKFVVEILRGKVGIKTFSPNWTAGKVKHEHLPAKRQKSSDLYIYERD